MTEAVIIQICGAKSMDWTGLYMITASVMKELNCCEELIHLGTLRGVVMEDTMVKCPWAALEKLYKTESIVMLYLQNA